MSVTQEEILGRYLYKSKVTRAIPQVLITMWFCCHCNICGKEGWPITPSRTLCPRVKMSVKPPGPRVKMTNSRFVHLRISSTFPIQPLPSGHLVPIPILFLSPTRDGNGIANEVI